MVEAMSTLRCKTIELQGQTLVIDGKAFPLSTHPCFFQSESLEVFYLPSYQWLRLPSFRRQALTLTQASRLNFIAPDLSESILDLEEFSNDSFSWFAFLGESKLIQPRRSILLPEGLTELITEVLSSSQKQVLLSSWKRDYIDCVLQKYDSSLKTSQLAALEQRLDEGIHYLYLRDQYILGHGCWTPVEFSLMTTPCLYWHQWIAPLTSALDRRAIHGRFFQALFGQSAPPMSGVALANPRAFRHCLKNSMNPVVFSTRLTR